jgi:hypothetical protein
VRHTICAHKERERVGAAMGKKEKKKREGTKMKEKERKKR